VSFLRIEHYLEEHLDHLRANPHDRVMYDARFRDADAKARFDELQKADADGFEDVTLELARRMHDASHQLVSNGLLVAVRRAIDHPEVQDTSCAAADAHGDDRPRIEVAVLKLDIHNPAARLVHEGDHAVLGPVRDALDLPDGPLPKAALYPDAEPDSEVIVVDHNQTTFFLNSIDAQQILEGDRARRQLEQFVRKTVRKTRRAEARDISLQVEQRIIEIASEDDGGRSAVDLVQRLDMLDEAEQTAICDAIRSGPMTVDRITPPDPTRQFELEGVEISFPTRLIGERVHKRQVGTAWQIVIDTETEPIW
jgi:hypothetical protein